MNDIEPAVAGLQKRLRELVACPESWHHVPAEGLREILREEWNALAQEYALRHVTLDETTALFAEPERSLIAAADVSIFFDLYGIAIDTETDALSLREAVRSIEHWIEQARDEYRLRWGKWRTMHFATRDDWRDVEKHFPRPRDTANDIRRRSYKDSCFHNGITRELLQDFMWYVFEALWVSVKNSASNRVYTDALTIIGASEGLDTSLMCWDINISKSIAHAYPVLRAEAERNHAAIYPIGDHLVGFTRLA